MRSVTAGRFTGSSTLDVAIPVVERDSDSQELAKLWTIQRLRGVRPKGGPPIGRAELRIVDLCSGAGGFATGLRWACEAVGLRPVVSAAVDINDIALGVYKANVRPLSLIVDTVSNLVRYELNDSTRFQSPRLINPKLRALVGDTDVVIAGPPCEGNSSFNNHTRGKDRRNELYVASVATAIALKAKVVIIENVAKVVAAKEKVVDRSLSMLAKAGYQVSENQTVLNAADFGVAQSRRRHFLIASRNKDVAGKLAAEGLRCSQMNVLDVLKDLLDRDAGQQMDQIASLSKENLARVNYLFKKNEYDLPDSERPDCHRTKAHSYSAVYGRMRPDEPSQTITTGFLSPGRGRYIHPTLPRGLTLREGARLQGFPDDYVWTPRGKALGRSPIAGLIGDAVPPSLGFVVGLIGISTL